MGSSAATADLDRIEWSPDGSILTTSDNTGNVYSYAVLNKGVAQTIFKVHSIFGTGKVGRWLTQVVYTPFNLMNLCLVCMSGLVAFVVFVSVFLRVSPLDLLSVL